MGRIWNIKPASFFVVVAICWYVVYFLVMPPFQSPDEYNHFYKAYRVAQGSFLPEQHDKRLGGAVPLSFSQFITPFHFSNADTKSKLSSADILHSFTVDCRPDITEFRDFANTSIYSPVSYLPQSLAIFVCSQLNFSVGTMFYSARFCGFFFWMMVVFYAIRIIPIGKWLLVLVSLLPMQLYICNSISADIVTDAMSFLWLALILPYAFASEQFSGRALWGLLTVACLLALAKVIYVWAVLLLFIIPAARFRSRWLQWGYILAIALPAILIASAWSNVVMQNYLFFKDYNPAFRGGTTLLEGADYTLQKQLLMQHPMLFFNVVCETLANFSFSLISYIGHFGTYMDLPLPTNWCIVAYLAILVVAILEKSDARLQIKQRLILLACLVIMLLLLFLAQYLSWTKVGDASVNGVQGRYLIPILPLFFFFWAGLVNRWRKALPLFVLLVVCSLNGVACNMLYDRYFGEDSKYKTEFSCDAEQTANGRLLTSDKNIQLESKAQRVNHEHLSGKTGVALLNDSAEAFIYRFKGLRQGDWLKAEVWHKGDGGYLLLEGKDSTQTYRYEERELRYSGQGPWQLMRMRVIMDKNADSADFVLKVCNTPGGKVYLDDFRLTLKRY